MNTRRLRIVTAAALAAFAGQALGQQQHERMSPSEARQLSQKLEQTDKSLTDAIQLAERETGGKALSAEILTSSSLQRIYSRQGQQDQMRRPGDPAERERQRERDPQAHDERQQERQQRQEEREERQQDRQDQQQRNRDRLTGGDQMQQGLHASVVCLVNNTQLRRVVVDLEQGRVVESRALTAGRDRGDTMRQGDVSAADPSHMRLASNILNSNAVNPAGDDLGDIDDLALDVTSGQVRYAVLRTGGFLGMGGDRHAVPLHALSFIGDGDVRININKEELEDRPGFDSDRWPQHPTAEWGEGRQVPGQQREDRQDREGQQPQVQRPGQQGQQISSTVEKATDVIGATLHGAGEATVGDVDDIVIKPSDSSISHYIIATDDGKVAVKASSITMQNRRLTLNMEQTQFEQLPRFRDNENPDWTNPKWLENLGDDDREPIRRDRDRNPDRGGG